jgi:hypothetical protein
MPHDVTSRPFPDPLPPLSVNSFSPPHLSQSLHLQSTQIIANRPLAFICWAGLVRQVHAKCLCYTRLVGDVHNEDKLQTTALINVSLYSVLNFRMCRMSNCCCRSRRRCVCCFVWQTWYTLHENLKSYTFSDLCSGGIHLESWSGYRLPWDRIFVLLLSCFGQMLEQYLELGHKRILPRFAIHH